MRRMRTGTLTPAQAIESRIRGLLLELEELPGWPDVYLHGGLLMRDVLLALGWSREDACRATGVEDRNTRPLDLTVIYGLAD